MSLKTKTLKQFREIKPIDVTELLRTEYFSLMSSFYETQSLFLTGIYNRFHSIETANILLCFVRNTHLEIIRQKEKNLYFDVSLEKLSENLDNITVPSEKIVTIVELTGIPKETVRRKVKDLLNKEYLSINRNEKKFSWKLAEKERPNYFINVEKEIQILSKFILKFSEGLNLDLNSSLIQNEIKSHFSFYWYHFLSCQLVWLKMWQTKLKDNDLLLIILQAIIPTLQHVDKLNTYQPKDINVDNMFKIVGKIQGEKNFIKTAVSATTVSDVTKIPRATCIRKLEKLVSMGFLLRETKTKRYYVNQKTEERTDKIMTKESVVFTIDSFSQLIAIILNSFLQNNK